MARSACGCENEDLKVWQKFYKSKYRRLFVAALRSVSASNLNPAARDIRNLSLETNGSGRAGAVADRQNFAADHGEYSGGSERVIKLNMKSFIEAILKDHTRPRDNQIIRLWHNIELKFGHGIKYILLLSLLIAYALLGGFLVHQFEAPAELEHNAQLDQQSVERHRIYAEKMMNLFSSPYCQLVLKPSSKDNKFMVLALLKQTACNKTIELMLEEYDELVGIHEYRRNLWRWSDYWNAVFYCGTVFTTIGYGNMWCRTINGRIFTILYALFGIPCMLVVLNEFGKLILMCVRSVWLAVRKLLKYFRRRRIRTYHVSDGLQTDVHRFREVPNDGNWHNSERYRKCEKEEAEEDSSIAFPIYGALLIIVIYITLCSLIFRIWEQWDYFTAFYFFFISLTTVGLGDEMPAHPHYACLFFLFFIVGLSLVSMCVSIAQIQFEMRLMKALQVISECSVQRALRPDNEHVIGDAVTLSKSVHELNPVILLPAFANSLPDEQSRRMSSLQPQYSSLRVPFVLETVLSRTDTTPSGKQN